jgi:tetratricopeptide (TPR) repeat protein
MSRRTRVLLLATLGLLAAGAGGWWYYHTSRPEYRLRRAQEAARAGDYPAAALAADSLEADGYLDEALLVRGEALLLRGEEQGRPADLSAALKVLSQVRPGGALGLEAACLSGRCLLRLGDLVLAERAFAFVVSRDENFVDAHRGLMAVYYDLGALPASMNHAQKWAELSPRDGRPLRFIGLLYKDMGQCSHALEPYREALGRDLKEAVKEEVRVELAECLARIREFAEAEEVLESGRPPAPLMARVLTVRADCRRARGEPGQAKELVDQALQANPTFTEALRVRAQLALDADNAAAAAGDLERAVALAPAEYDTHHLLAQAYAQLGQPKKAQAARARVKEIQAQLQELTDLTFATMERPKDAGLHLKMAELFTKLGRPEMAAHQRRIAAGLSGPAPGAAAPPPMPP